jgi:predicted Zn-dependent protease
MDERLSQAIELIKAGKKADGGRILAEMVKTNPNDELAWQWLASCVGSEEQKRHCLDQALRINPQNEQAKKMLDALEFKPVFEPSPQPIQVQIAQSPAVAEYEKTMKAANLLQNAGCFMISLVVLVPIIIIGIIFLWGMLTG